MKTYEYLLFDWDGCLAKTLDLHLDCYKKTFAEFGMYPTDKEITQDVFGDWNGPRKLGVEDLKLFTEKYLERVHEAYPTVELYEGASETISALKQKGKRLALLTTSLRKTVQPALERHHLLNQFEIILAGEDVKNHKPDPEIIEKALMALGGRKDNTIIIGDSKSDLGAAKNAGIDSLLYFPEHNHLFYDEELLKSYGPTYEAGSFADILSLLL